MFSIEEKKLCAYLGSTADQLYIPDGVETLSARVFLGHSELTRVTLCDDLKTLGPAAFSGCENLENVRFGTGLRRIGEDCFRGCSALRSAELPEDVASIRRGVFAECGALAHVTLPSGLRRRIEGDTFAGCRSLRHIVIPAQVEMIEFGAFSDCVSLSHAVFENPDIRIERGAFVGCSSLDEETRRFIDAHTFSRVVLEIRSASRGALGRLSNFTARSFVFDGIPCGSIEGVLQSFKCPDPAVQAQICRLSGGEARAAGAAYRWQEQQMLYWQGQAYPRTGEAYQQLLDRLYDAVYEQDASFREDLYQVRGRELSHRLGRSDPASTILTRRELTERLERLSQR